MAEPLRVVIAEDNYLVREGIRRLLVESGVVDVLAAVESAPLLVDAANRLGPDAVLTDIRMPLPGGSAERADGGQGADGVEGMEGIQAAHAIRAAHPDMGVVVLSQYSDAAYAYALFKRGTDGLAYLLKDRVAQLSVLLDALAEVSLGGSVVDPQVVDALVSRQVRLRATPLAALSERELSVLREMAGGRGNRGIAAELHLSESTVEKHINAIFVKLGLDAEPLVHRRVSAVLAYLRDSGLRG
jgi:DNA-binding NarL/FixJ family response regulator